MQVTLAVAMHGLTVRHGGGLILDAVDLAVPSGAFVAILGPNGAGKSTLLNVIPRLVASRGHLRVLGKDVNRLSFGDRNQLRRRIGVVPQLHARTPSVLPLTVREVVEMGRTGVRGVGRALTREDRERVDHAMELVDLTVLTHRSYGVLSGGEQRKVHLARALAQQPELLLLDEPAGHLDLRWQEEITVLAGRIWREQRLTVLMVTHDPRHLPAGITHGAVLSGGRLLHFGPLADVMNASLFSELYGLPLHVRIAGGRYLVLPEMMQ